MAHGASWATRDDQQPVRLPKRPAGLLGPSNTICHPNTGQNAPSDPSVNAPGTTFTLTSAFASSSNRLTSPERTSNRMTIGSTPGSAGIAVIIATCIAVSAIITVVTGSFVHWPFVIAGIAVGLWAVSSINK